MIDKIALNFINKLCKNTSFFNVICKFLLNDAGYKTTSNILKFTGFFSICSIILSEIIK